MNFDKLVNSILHEAFPLGWAKAYSKRNSPLYKDSKELIVKKIKQLFKNKDRLVYYLPPDENGNASKEDRNNPTRDAIDKFLHTHGYNCFYYDGYAIKNNDRHNTKINIGKLLQRLEQDKTTVATNIHGKQHVVQGSPLLHAYKNDKIRIEDKNIGYYVVVCRHPYDVAGAYSGDRNYGSCQTGHSPKIARGTGDWRQDVANHNAEMNDLGYNHWVYKGSKVPKWHGDPSTELDPKLVDLVAYLVPEDYDKSKDILRNPLARVALSVECHGNRVYMQHPDEDREDNNPEQYSEFYGESNEEFIKFIKMYTAASFNDWDSIVNLPTVD